MGLRLSLGYLGTYCNYNVMMPFMLVSCPKKGKKREKKNEKKCKKSMEKVKKRNEEKKRENMRNTKKI